MTRIVVLGEAPPVEPPPPSTPPGPTEPPPAPAPEPARVVAERPSPGSLRILLGSDDISEYVAEGARFSNTDPGGFEVAELTLPRDVRIPRGEKLLVTAGLETAWEGRVAEIDRELSTDTIETRIQADGAGAVLRDDELSMIYVDRDIQAWKPISRRVTLKYIAHGRAPHTPESHPDPDGFPSVSTGWEGAWNGDVARPLCEARYDAEGNAIHYIWHDVQEEGLTGDHHWSTYLSIMENDGWIGSWLESYDARLITETRDLHDYGPRASYLVSPSPGRSKFAAMRFFNWGGGEQAGVDQKYFGAHWRNPAVYGHHGLPRRGPNPGGFYPSDIAGDVIARTNGVDVGVVEPFPSFVVPHASYRVPVAREQIISEMGAYAGAHWGTWESARGLSAKTNPRFHFTAQPTARTAWTTRAHADQLSLAERLDSLYNRCRVAFTDPFGDQRYVTVVRVNPYLDPLGLTRTLLLETGTFTAAAATALANTALDLAERAGRIAGQITLRGDVGADAGPKPAALLKAGRDRLAITDLPALEGLLGTRDNEFHVRRVDTTLGAAGPSTTAELGIGADPLEVLQARLAARTGVITGEVGR